LRIASPIPDRLSDAIANLRENASWWRERLISLVIAPPLTAL
jgi:hypothetical protein